MLTNKNYKQFLDHHRRICKEYGIKDNNIKKLSVTNGTSVTKFEDDEFVMPITNEFKVINGKIELSYEALAFLMQIEGHDKNLFLFIITYCKNDDYSFQWNRMLAEHYADYFESVRGTRPSYNTVRQSIYALKELNIIKKIVSGKYMINPLLIADSLTNRRIHFKTYTDISKKENVIDALLSDAV